MRSLTQGGSLQTPPEAATFTRLGQGKYQTPVDPRSVVAPQAPLQRPVNPSPPTVAISTTNPQASGRQVPFWNSNVSPVGSAFFTPAAGALWTQTSGGAISGWANHTSTDGTLQYSPASVMLGYDGPGNQITFMFKSNNSNFYRLKVDDQYITDINSTAGPGGATTQYLTITFSSQAPRRIRFDMMNGFLYAVYIGKTDTVWAIKPRGPRVAVVGDSYGSGNGVAPTGYTGLNSYVWGAADALGWDDCINGCIYGTGYIARSNGQNNNAQDRAAAIVSWAPDVLIFTLGHNDIGQTTANVQAAVDATLSVVRKGLPNALIIVTGPLVTGDPTDGSANTTYTALQAAIFSGAAPYRVITVDTVASGLFTGAGKAGSRTVADGVTNSTTTVTSATASFISTDNGRLITGAGIPAGTTIASVTNSTTAVLSAAATASASGVSLTITNQTGSGNGDIYISSDGTHPSQAGAEYLGRRMTNKILAALAAA